MSSEREGLLGEAQLLHKLVRWAIFQEAILPSWLELQISTAQLKGVLVLAYLGQSTIRDFAERLHITPSAGSLLIDRLVQEGLVERTEDREDRRRMVIRLSGAGMEVAARLRQEKEEHDRSPIWFARLNPNDLQAMVQGLRALVTEIEADLERPFPDNLRKILAPEESFQAPPEGGSAD